jgi:hypothetical protein
MELMAAYPGRKFRMLELVNYIAGRHADHRAKKQVRMGASRVLQMLEESGQLYTPGVPRFVMREKCHMRKWKVPQKVLHFSQQSCVRTMRKPNPPSAGFCFSGAPWLVPRHFKVHSAEIR